jgi:hypothetical protein
MKLSDTQLLILSSASQRTDHAAVLPVNLKGSAAKKVVDRLLNEKLLQERPAKDDMPVWRRGDDNKPYSMRITKAGLRAIEVQEAAGTSDHHAGANPGEGAAAVMRREVKSSERSGRTKRTVAKIAALSAKAIRVPSDRAKGGSKQDKIVALLQRPEGVTLDALIRETRWQKHSLRGFLAGTVRKKLKLPLLSEKIDGVRNYRIGGVKSAKTKKMAARKA